MRHFRVLLVTLLAFSHTSGIFAQSSNPPAPPLTSVNVGPSNSGAASAPPTASANPSGSSGPAPPTSVNGQSNSGAASAPPTSTDSPPPSASANPSGSSGVTTTATSTSTTTSNSAAATLARNNCYIGNGTSGSTGAGNASSPGFNTGISLSSADTSLLVAFGDSWSANGAPNGTKPDGPLYVPDDGLLIQTGTERMSNGYTWIEWLSMDSSIPLRDYAVPGAVIDKTVYAPGAHPSDFNDQADLFVSQNIQFNPNNTVFAVFLGSEDTSGPNFDTDLLPKLMSNVQTKLIQSVGAQNFLFIAQRIQATRLPTATCSSR
ncbi:hypothetical protein K438DRAFT_1163835 [Mycena galopus ATCC 62051]|nr:hypothetical protein K438DRAFT_1163835 [Mycena galopus ATCC 62051]